MKIKIVAHHDSCGLFALGSCFFACLVYLTHYDLALNQLVENALFSFFLSIFITAIPYPWFCKKRCLSKLVLYWRLMLALMLCVYSVLGVYFYNNRFFPDFYFILSIVLIFLLFTCFYLLRNLMSINRLRHLVFTNGKISTKGHMNLSRAYRKVSSPTTSRTVSFNKLTPLFITSGGVLSFFESNHPLLLHGFVLIVGVMVYTFSLMLLFLALNDLLFVVFIFPKAFRDFQLEGVS